MRKLALILCILLSINILNVFGQAPESLNYQAVIRDNTGELVLNKDIDVRITIIDNAIGGTTLYQESHSVSTNNFGLVNLKIGEGNSDQDNFADINWGTNPKYLKVEVDVGNGFVNLGTIQLVSVPYALYSNSTDYANTSGTASNADFSIFADSARVAGMAYTAGVADALGSVGVYSTSTDTLFVVKDHDGKVVFAVFPDGAQIIVNEAAKGKVGGFAVSGRSPSKSTDVEILKVTSDSTRVYINDAVTAKGKVGGFAVSGRSPSKGTNSDILFVNVDSTRIYVNDDPTAKGKVGGFAVSGRSPSKGGDSKFMDITSLNSFIGLEAGKSNTTGERNAFMGYQAGYTNTEGFDNVFIGNEAGLSNLGGASNIFLGTSSGKSNIDGIYNIFIGSGSGEQNTTGGQNIAIGEQSGYSLQTGRKNIFIGTVAGYSNVDGLDNVFIGNYAGNASTGSSNVYIGRMAGIYNTIGIGNVFIGEQSGWNNVEGSGNVFIGKGAGADELGSNKLYISNSDTEIPLIYGEFDHGLVEVQGSLKLNDILNLKPKTTVPGSPAKGDVFYDANSNTIKFFNGTTWMELSATISVSTPLVTTDNIPALSLLATSCIVNYNISDQGGSAIIESGVYFSLTPFFDIGSAIKFDYPTPGLGDFSLTITGLSQNKLYYVRSFATNSDGTSLGNMMTFTTPYSSALPSVTTSTVLSITQTTATGGGDVTLPGGKTLTAVGICWNTTPGPTIADNFTSESVGLESFSSNMTGLVAETTYYVRAYAANAIGTAYGEEIVFTTASDITTVSDIEGNIYNTVQIGTQTWMKENLKTTKYNDGSDIPNIIDNTEWLAQTDGAYCWYDNDADTYKDTYGALYNYYTVVDSRNLCPTGWHVPTNTDWTDLSDYLGDDDTAGGKLKEAGTTHWLSNTGADNSTGFTALPGGYRWDTYDFGDMGAAGEWWSPTEYTETYGWIIYLETSLRLTITGDYKSTGCSVRCLKD